MPRSAPNPRRATTTVPRATNAARVAGVPRAMPAVPGATPAVPSPRAVGVGVVTPRRRAAVVAPLPRAGGKPPTTSKRQPKGKKS